MLLKYSCRLDKQQSQQPLQREQADQNRAAAEKAVTLFTQTLPTESSHKIKPSDAGSKATL